MRFGEQTGRYELDPFPGNGDVVVSHSVTIWPEVRGQGHGKSQHISRLIKATELGYHYIICTVRADNLVEIHLLEKNDWTRLETFVGSSGESIIIFRRHL